MQGWASRKWLTEVRSAGQGGEAGVTHGGTLGLGHAALVSAAYPTGGQSTRNVRDAKRVALVTFTTVLPSACHGLLLCATPPSLGAS